MKKILILASCFVSNGVAMQSTVFYYILGVNNNADAADIKDAYKEKAAACHPEKGGNENEFIKFSNAYSVLGDTQKRKEYDAQLAVPFVVPFKGTVVASGNVSTQFLVSLTKDEALDLFKRCFANEQERKQFLESNRSEQPIRGILKNGSQTNQQARKPRVLKMNLKDEDEAAGDGRLSLSEYIAAGVIGAYLAYEFIPWQKLNTYLKNLKTKLQTKNKSVEESKGH